MTTARKMALEVIVGARDKASAVLARVQAAVAKVKAPADKLRGLLRMTGVPQALGRVTDLAVSMGRTFISAGTKVAAFGAVAATAIGAVVQRVTSAGDKTLKFSRQIGLNVERLQEWRYAAEQAGIPAESFDKALAKLGLRAAQARAGVGEARDYFKALGISMTDAAGNGRELEDLLPEIADKIAAIADPNARGVFLGKFFDDEGVALERMLNRGSEGLAGMARQARDLGAVASAETLGGFEEFQGTVGKLRAQFAGLTSDLVARLLPAIHEVAETFSVWLQGNQERFREWATWLAESLPGALATFSAGVKESLRSLESLARSVSDIYDGLSRFADFTLDVLGVPNPALERRRERDAELERIRTEVIYNARQGAMRDTGVNAAAQAASLLIRFAGAPAGMRVETDRAARRMVNLDVGYAMPEVGR